MEDVGCFLRFQKMIPINFFIPFAFIIGKNEEYARFKRAKEPEQNVNGDENRNGAREPERRNNRPNEKKPTERARKDFKEPVPKIARDVVHYLRL